MKNMNMARRYYPFESMGCLWKNYFETCSIDETIFTLMLCVDCFQAHAGKERSDPLDDAIDKMYKKTKDLRRQVRHMSCNCGC